MVDYVALTSLPHRTPGGVAPRIVELLVSHGRKVESFYEYQQPSEEASLPVIEKFAPQLRHIVSPFLRFREPIVPLLNKGIIRTLDLTISAFTSSAPGDVEAVFGAHWPVLEHLAFTVFDDPIYPQEHFRQVFRQLSDTPMPALEALELTQGYGTQLRDSMQEIFACVKAHAPTLRLFNFSSTAGATDEFLETLWGPSKKPAAARGAFEICEQKLGISGKYVSVRGVSLWNWIAESAKPADAEDVFAMFDDVFPDDRLVIRDNWPEELEARMEELKICAFRKGAQGRESAVIVRAFRPFVQEKRDAILRLLLNFVEPGRENRYEFSSTVSLCFEMVEVGAPENSDLRALATAITIYPYCLQIFLNDIHVKTDFANAVSLLEAAELVGCFEAAPSSWTSYPSATEYLRLFGSMIGPPQVVQWFGEFLNADSIRGRGRSEFAEQLVSVAEKYPSLQPIMLTETGIRVLLALDPPLVLRLASIGITHPMDLLAHNAVSIFNNSITCESLVAYTTQYFQGQMVAGNSGKSAEDLLEAMCLRLWVLLIGYYNTEASLTGAVRCVTSAFKFVPQPVAAWLNKKPHTSFQVTLKLPKARKVILECLETDDHFKRDPKCSIS